MDLDARELMAIAEAVVDEIEPFFRANVGAPPVLRKERGDFATEADLHIERHMALLLTRMTGLPVLGEEYGGLDRDTHWVIDPIDGTGNYSVGYPMCGILVALIDRGRPVAAVVSLPLLRSRYTAFDGGGLRINGLKAPRLSEPRGPVTVGFGSIIAPTDGEFPMDWRQRLLNRVGERFPSLRIDGSVGVDLALTAAGVFGGSLTFSPHVWDNAAGVLLITEAGGVATDLVGRPWTPDSAGVLAGTPDIHARLLDVVRSLTPPNP